VLTDARIVPSSKLSEMQKESQWSLWHVGHTSKCLWQLVAYPFR
jgi:hypothetical protein